MSLLITGGSGFVGTHLTDSLKKKKIEYINYDLVDGDDIRDKYKLEQVFEKEQITEVIHLAALAGVRRSKKYPEEYISTNILGTQNIVDLCNEYKIKHLIFYSSSSVFGDHNGKEVKENDYKIPLSLYGITKLAGENIINNAECKTTIVRPFTIYGENGRKDEVIYKWLEQIKNNKPITVYDINSYRGYVYVKDIVGQTISLLKKEYYWKHEDFNIGGSEKIYLRDILKVFNEEFKNLKISKLDRMREDVFGQIANIDKAREILKYNPQSKFIGNLKKIINNFKNNE